MFATLPGRSLPGRIRDRARRRLRGEDGFILLESIIAISLITVIMTAVGVEFLTGLSSTTQQRARSAAVQLADSNVEGLRALHSSDLVKGRDKSSVTVEYNRLAAVPAVAPWLNSDPAHLAYDPSVATGGATAAVPTAAVTQKPGPISYQLYDYLECVLVSTNGSCASTSAVPNNSIRAIVAVIWTQQGCPANTCSYVTSTIINADADPTFDLNQALPPAPVVTDPGAQTVAVNDLVSLQLNVQNGKGVAPFTWALTGGALPNGLTLSPAGLIGGTVQAPSGSPSYPLSGSSVITVTDAFLRQASITINWTTYPPLQVVQPDQSQSQIAMSSLTTDNVNFPLQASGGQGVPYTWSVATGSLPPGLSLPTGNGSITGTPTTPGQYAFTLKVTDKSGTRSVMTKPITWTVAYPPLAASNPSDQTDTVGASISLSLTASGGDGKYVWSDPSGSLSATGLSISSSGKITGTLTGTVRDFPISLTANDPTAGSGFTKTVAFTWHVVAKPSIDSPGTQAMTETGAVNVPLHYSCPDSPCSVALANAPPGLGLDASGSNSGSNATTTLTGLTGSGTVYIDGVVSTSAVTVGNSKAYAPSVTITDKDNVTVTPSSGNWTVNVQPTISVSPASAGATSVEFPPNGAISGMATASLGTGSYTYTLSGNPAWLTINKTSGAITGSAQTTRQQVKFTVTATDSDSVATSTNVIWYVDDLGWQTIPDQSTTHSKNKGNTNTGSLTLASYVVAGGGGYTYALAGSGNPAWISLSGSTLTATAPTSTTSATVTVAVTDKYGCTQVTAFTWKIT